MGFLSLAQQAPWLLNPYYAQQPNGAQAPQSPATQQTQPTQAAPQAPLTLPQPYAPPQPRPQQSRPFAPNLPQIMQPTQLPDQRPGTSLAELPTFNAGASLRPASFMEQLEGRTGMNGMDLGQLGLAMMGAGEPGGGGWQTAAQAFGDIRQGAQHRQRQAREDEREDQQWSWAAEERRNTVERRRMAQEFIATQPAERQAELRMIDPDQLGGYLQQQRAFDLQVEENRNNERRFQQSIAVDRARLANDRFTTSLQGRLGMLEANSMGGMQERLQNWRLIDNDISRIEYWNNHPRADELWQTILGGTEEEVMRRLTARNDREGLQMAQEIYAIGAQMARDELRGQTPVSNIDFMAALRGNPNTASTRGFVQNWLERAYQDRQLLEGQYQSALSHNQQYGNLYAVNPATGRNWYQDTYNNYQRPRPQGVGGGGPRGGAPPAEAVAALRRDHSAESRREFDEMYGQGAAARALSGQRQQQNQQQRSRPRGGGITGFWGQ